MGSEYEDDARILSKEQFSMLALTWLMLIDALIEIPFLTCQYGVFMLGVFVFLLKGDEDELHVSMSIVITLDMYRYPREVVVERRGTTMMMG